MDKPNEPTAELKSDELSLQDFPIRDENGMVLMDFVSYACLG